MTPADINVITLDGHTHTVKEKTPITIAVHAGPIDTVNYATADADGNLNITQGDGRTSFLLLSVGGTRYVCSCGLSFDQIDTDLSDQRFDQGASVDCPDC